MTDEIQQLFEETKIAFENAPIKKYAEQNNLHWSYSICSTKLQQNCNLLIGFNWGAAKDFKYLAQSEIPGDTFKQLYDKKELGSFQRLYDPLNEYLKNGDVDNFSQTNFCFFRSATEAQITKDDLKLSTPLFEKLIQIIAPKKIIGFSSTLRNYFLDNNLCTSLQQKSIIFNNKTLLVCKGTYKIKETETPIYFLPHPNAQLTSEARKEAWEFCFSQ